LWELTGGDTGDARRFTWGYSPFLCL